MMSILRRLKEKLFGNEADRACKRTIRRERATLRRWAERAQGNRFHF
jgi:hypothetical protein